MAKRKKTAARAGKPKPPLAPKPWVALEPKSSIEEDVDSDDGRFLDDDTEDFLPAVWKGDTVLQKVSNNDSAFSTSNDSEIMNETTSCSLLATLNFSPVDADIVSTDQTITTQTTTTEVPTAAETTFVQKTVTISRLQVPVSILSKPKKPTSQVEELQAQVKALTFELEKKERDLKSAKNEASTARAKQSISKQSQIDAFRKLEIQLKAKLEAESRDLKIELGNVEGERRKATADLRKLRVKYELLEDKHKEINKSLDQANKLSDHLTQEIKRLKSARTVSDEIITKLRADLAAAKVEKRRLHQQASREKNVQRTVRTEYNDLVTDYNNLLEQNTHSSTSIYFNGTLFNPSLLDANYRDLQSKHDEVVEELQYEKSEVSRLEAKSTSLVTQLNLAKREAKSNLAKWAPLEAKNYNLMHEISSLEAKVNDLETDRDLKAPLIKVAADIRLRYLENSREVVENIARAEVDRAIIMDGNNAAHRANGAVDAALFKLDLVPEGYIEDAMHIFQQLYQLLPRNYNWAPSSMRLIDCRATLKSLKPADGIKSYEERDRHNELDAQIVELLNSDPSNCFGLNDQVEALLLEIEELTDEIVETDRSKYRRRRRYVSETHNDAYEEDLDQW